jgi:hypothetical protein
MATITSASCTDDVVTLTLDDATGLVVGEHVHVYGTGYNKLDGHHNLTGVDGLDVQYSVNNQDDIAAYTPDNGVLVAQVTWITTEDVELFVGQVEAATDEADYLELCTDAANDWAYHRREAAGYSDNPTVVPGAAAKQGTVLYAGSLFRQKGSLDNFQSFEAMPTPAPVGSMGEIMRLLGIGRARIG